MVVCVAITPLRVCKIAVGVIHTTLLLLYYFTVKRGHCCGCCSLPAVWLCVCCQVVMQAYESDLQRPIRGLVSGELARTLLIQVPGAGWGV